MCIPAKTTHAHILFTNHKRRVQSCRGTNEDIRSRQGPPEIEPPATRGTTEHHSKVKLKQYPPCVANLGKVSRAHDHGESQMLPASGLQRRLGDPLHSTVSATCGPVHLSGIPARGAEARCDAASRHLSVTLAMLSLTPAVAVESEVMLETMVAAHWPRPLHPQLADCL